MQVEDLQEEKPDDLPSDAVATRRQERVELGKESTEEHVFSKVQVRAGDPPYMSFALLGSLSKKAWPWLRSREGCKTLASLLFTYPLNTKNLLARATVDAKKLRNHRKRDKYTTYHLAQVFGYFADAGFLICTNASEAETKADRAYKLTEKGAALARLCLAYLPQIIKQVNEEKKVARNAVARARRELESLKSILSSSGTGSIASGGGKF